MQMEARSDEKKHAVLVRKPARCLKKAATSSLGALLRCGARYTTGPIGSCRPMDRKPLQRGIVSSYSNVATTAQGTQLLTIREDTAADRFFFNSLQSSIFFGE